MVVLLADPNLGLDAVFRAQGSGPQVALRVVRSVPDRLADAFGTTIVQATAALPAVEAGDTFLVGTDLLTVQHAERDAAGVAWRVFCRR